MTNPIKSIWPLLTYNLRYFNFMVIIVSLILVNGCNKPSINGDLDGKWQVMEVVENGDLIEFPEGRRFYYNFYLHICQLGGEQGYIENFTANMCYNDDMIHLVMPLVKAGEASSSELRTLRFWGIPVSGEITFRIDCMTHSYLEMSSDSVVVRCRRF